MHSIILIPVHILNFVSMDEWLIDCLASHWVQMSYSVSCRELSPFITIDRQMKGTLSLKITYVAYISLCRKVNCMPWCTGKWTAYDSFLSKTFNQERSFYQRAFPWFISFNHIVTFSWMCVYFVLIHFYLADKNVQ